MNDIKILDVTSKMAYAKYNEKKDCKEYKLLVEGLTKEDYESFKEVFKDVGKKYIPNWYKEQNSEMFLKSRYDIPVKTTDDEQIKFSEWIDRGMTINAKIRIKIVLKDGIIYPKVIKVLEDGEQVDLFADM